MKNINMNLNSSELNTIKKFNHRDLIIFILPILIFSLYLYTYNPGILTLDSFSLLHQIATGSFSNAFPTFYTLIVIFSLKIFGTLMTVGIFQILVFSLMWMVICRYHRKSEDINEFLIQFIITLIICLIPINAAYSIALSSYALFGYSILFLAFLIKVMVDKQGQINMAIIILMAVTMAFLSGLSSYGIYIALISLIFIIAYLFMKNQSQNTLITLTTLTIVCIIFIGSFSFIFHTEDGESLKSTNILDDEINLDNAKNQYFSSINASPKEGFEDVSAPNLGNSKYDLINSIVDLTRENFLFNTLFNSPLTYLVLSIIALAFIYTTIKTEEIWLIFVPNLLVTIIATLTSQVSTYSNLLFFYLIAIILISLHFNGSLIAKGSAKPKAKPKNVKMTPTPQEDYNVEDSYYDLENELESLTFDDITEMIGETPIEEQTIQTQEASFEGDSDLIDEILKEIENERK